MNFSRGIVCLKRRPRRGLTLLEVSIGLLILGLMMSLVIPSVEGVTGAKLKTSVQQLAGAIRYVYNQSVTHHLYCRIAFDLENHSYRGECSADRVLLAQEAEEAADGKKKEEVSRFSNDSDFGLSEAELEEKKLREYEPKFEALKSQAFEAAKLPAGVAFDGVWTMHQEEPYTAGSAYLYFFPSGFAEPSSIWLSDAHENVFTLEVEPITGKARVYNYRRELDANNERE